MKVYVLMVRIKQLFGGCDWEVREYIKGIYLDKVCAESTAKELQNNIGISRYDYKISYYVKEWEVK